MDPLVIDPAKVIWNINLAEGHPTLADRPLLVMLHGHGSNERIFAELGFELPSEFVIATPRAPLQVGPDQFGWQPYDGVHRPPVPELHAAVEAITTWLDQTFDQYGEPAGCCLLGFSQGAAMAAQLFRDSKARFDAGIFLSGYIDSSPCLGDELLEATRPPMFYGVDPAEGVIRSAWQSEAGEFLARHFEVESHQYYGIGHSVSPGELRDVSAFLLRHLG